jgi:RNA polymerase sigma-70 factor (ECF subfamily)
MTEDQDGWIARGLTAGDPEAWRALYDAYSERVWNTAARLLGPVPADVADVVQETFLAAAGSARNFDPGRGNLWMWLTGILRNQVADLYRKRKRHDRVRGIAPWLADELKRWLAGNDADPSAALEAGETADLVRAALGTLSADHEGLLIARYFDGASIADLVARSGSTSTAIRSKLSRARVAFRDSFARLAGFDEAIVTEEPHGH